MSHHENEKKKKQREKNNRIWNLFRQAKELSDNVAIGAPEHSVKDGKPARKPLSEPSSARLTSFRNRLDNSRRVAKDDFWNRGAGTSDSGGKGR